MTDRWIGVIWAAFAAAILGVCVAAATSGEAPSTTLLVALVVIPLLVTVSARLSRSRRSRRKREPHDAATEASGARSVRDPARRISRSPEPQSAISRKPDWGAVASMCSALNVRHLDWLRANDFAMPWLDVRVRPVIELEPLLAAAADQSFEGELRSTLHVLLGAVGPFVAFYNESTAPDPLLLGEEWRFFERDEAVIEAETGVGEDLWGGRAAHLHELAVQVADAYAQFVSVASREARVRRQVALPA